MKRIILAFPLLLLLATCIGQQTSSGKDIYLSEGIAIKGYDPVAYFLQNAPAKGDAAFSFNWQGATWLFANRQHLEAFRASPEKYAPQFGGYCAYGASRGYKAPTDPEAFTVSGGRLFLNYSLKVKEEWLKDSARRIDLANKYWDSL